MQNRNLCGYRVEWRESGTSWWQTHEFMHNSHSPGYTIRGLKRNTDYEVRVFVKSGYWTIPDEQAFDTRTITTE